MERELDRPCSHVFGLLPKRGGEELAERVEPEATVGRSARGRKARMGRRTAIPRQMRPPIQRATGSSYSPEYGRKSVRSEFEHGAPRLGVPRASPLAEVQLEGEQGKWGRW